MGGRGKIPNSEFGISTHQGREAASTTPVPPFTLSEFIAFQLSDAFGANNVKSGTLLTEARQAMRQGGTSFADAKSDHRACQASSPRPAR